MFKIKNELSLCHTIYFSNPKICTTQCRINISNYESIKIKLSKFEITKVTPSGCKDTGIRSFQFVDKDSKNFPKRDKTNQFPIKYVIKRPFLIEYGFLICLVEILRRDARPKALFTDPH